MPRRIAAFILVATGLLLAAGSTLGEVRTQETKLNELSQKYAERWRQGRGPLYYDLLSRQTGPQGRLNRDESIQLLYIDERGMPRYYAFENLTAARTISTDDVWPGGSAGLDLDGTGTTNAQLGVWDGGGVLWTHQEFGGRVTQQDSPSSIHYHSTHVAGTMIASGVNSNAKGMSPAAELSAYDWDLDDSEMAAAAANGLNVSNHSYGFVTGWYWDSGEGIWYFYGDTTISQNEDYGFGFYGFQAHNWDEIAHNAPFYLICKSAGNDRNDNGPTPGGVHLVFNGSDWDSSYVVRDKDGGPDGYDCISWYSTAKNILTVGAVNDLPAGYSSPAGVSMSSFSCWGPTDDGRIKPDITANGVSLFSTGDGGINSYITLSGTSMSTPNASGSANLLFRYYESSHGGQTPLASTIKGLIIHTADEAGDDPGPDYRFGWGLMNTRKAAELIQADSAGTAEIVTSDLSDGDSDLYYVASDGVTPIRVTISWTDLPGTSPAASLNPPDLMLVNDLDLRIEEIATNTIFEPYILDPAVPSAAAGTGDNFRDNVEQVYIDAPPAGLYAITVGHKNSLTGTQTYSLISSHPFFEPCCGAFTGGVTGNADYSADGVVDLSDVLYMANAIFLGGPAFQCAATANTDGDAGCVTDISDILWLAGSVFLGGPANADCLFDCES